MIGLTQQEQVEFERIKDEMWNYGYETAKKEFGWHPASELPPVNEIGESQDVIVICGTTNLYFDLPRWSKVVEGVWGDKNVKWWCYPPKEE